MTVRKRNLIEGNVCYYCMFMVYTQRKNMKKKNNENTKKIKRYHESGDALQGSGLTHFLSFWGPLPYIKEGPIIISFENLF